MLDAEMLDTALDTNKIIDAKSARKCFISDYISQDSKCILLLQLWYDIYLSAITNRSLNGLFKTPAKTRSIIVAIL